MSPPSSATGRRARTVCARSLILSLASLLAPACRSVALSESFDVRSLPRVDLKADGIDSVSVYKIAVWRVDPGGSCAQAVAQRSAEDLAQDLYGDLVDCSRRAGLEVVPNDEGIRRLLEERLAEEVLEPEFFQSEAKFGEALNTGGFLLGQQKLALRAEQTRDSRQLTTSLGNAYYEVRDKTVWHGRLELTLAVYDVETRGLAHFSPDILVEHEALREHRPQEVLDPALAPRPAVELPPGFVDELERRMELELAKEFCGHREEETLTLFTGQSEYGFWGLGDAFTFRGIAGFQEGRRLLQRGKAEGAIAVFQAALDGIDPGEENRLLRARARHNLGVAQLLAGAYDEAWQAFDMVLDEYDFDATRQALELCELARG